MTRLVAFAKAFALASVILVVPAIVDAGPLSSPRPTLEAPESRWFESALEWMSRIFVGEAGSPTRRSVKPVGDGSSYNRAIGSTGSCIDPMGNPVPCNGGG